MPYANQSRVQCLRYFVRSITVYKVCSCMPGDILGHVITTRENLSRFVETDFTYSNICIQLRNCIYIFMPRVSAYVHAGLLGDIFGRLQLWFAILSRIPFYAKIHTRLRSVGL
jgi:hypothetical protein